MATKAAPSKAIAKVEDGPKLMTEKQARAVTDQIRTGLGKTLDLIKKAFDGQAWKVLQHGTEGRPYKDWDEYVKAEFADIPLTLPRAKRKETVVSLHSLGWSTRAIAPVVGADNKTVHNDIKEAEAAAPTVENSTDDGDIIDGQIVTRSKW